MQRYLAVLVLVTGGAVACARTPQMLTPAPLEARAHSHRIGILEPSPLLLTYPAPPTPGVGPGYKRGVGECFDRYAAASHLILAATAVLCPTVGGTVGAALGPSVTEMAEAQAALERIAREHPFGDGLRGELAQRLAREAPHYAVALLAPDGTDPLGAPVDAVVALTNPTVTLVPYNRTRIRTDGARLTLHVSVDAELRRPDTNVVLHRAPIEYWGERFPFMDWGAAGGERLALGLARAQRSLAEQFVQSVFLAQGPTAMKRPFHAHQP